MRGGEHPPKRGGTRAGGWTGPGLHRPMGRTATAVILLAMLAGACEPSLERSQATRSPAGANADARHVVVDTDLAFDDIMALL